MQRCSVFVAPRRPDGRAQETATKHGTSAHEAAARPGGARFPSSRVLGLTYLAPAIQERILLGDMVVSENRLRAVCRAAAWSDQGHSLQVHNF